MKLLGIAGWSGAGKTTLVVKLITAFTARGLRVATVKHAHHDFDIDQPGKDSFVHRQAGAGEVIVSSARRFALIHELAEDEAEMTLPALLKRLAPCDLVLVEGFKMLTHPKLEVFRVANGREPLHPCDPCIVGVASDRVFPEAKIPVVPLDDVAAISHLVFEKAVPIEQALARLMPNPHHQQGVKRTS
ncbi:MAG: molybdopterin-guanine dinucleotide biosynthesis protein B [Hyphomicrobiales bacterium]|nr:molybdopterin-guanine dinucleotide biosynthesis protein B [Hyphomicrobiales bacterium]